MAEDWRRIGGGLEDWRTGGGLEEGRRRIGEGLEEDVSIDVRSIFDKSSRIGGGLEEDWRRIGGGLEEDWRRIGGGCVDRYSIDSR